MMAMDVLFHILRIGCAIRGDCSDTRLYKNAIDRPTIV